MGALDKYKVKAPKEAATKTVGTKKVTTQVKTGALSKYREQPQKAKVVVPKKSVLESAFDTESYGSKFKKGDIKGGVANLVASPLTALQSSLNNILDVPHAIAHGEKPSFMYNMGPMEREKRMADRSGGIPLNEKISNYNPHLGTLYKFAMEIATDPLELTPFGFMNDIKLAKGLGKGSKAYEKSLQGGKMANYTPPKGGEINSTSAYPAGKRRSYIPQYNKPPIQQTPIGSPYTLLPEGINWTEGKGPIKALPEPKLYVDPAGGASFSPQRSLSRTESFVKNKTIYTVDGEKIEKSLVPELFNDMTVNVFDDNDVKTIKALIHLGEKSNQDVKILTKKYIGSVNTDVKKAVDEVMEVFRNYKGKGVELYPQQGKYTDTYGSDEFKMIRGSLNEGWYSDFYKKYKKAPTKTQKAEIGKEHALYDLENGGGEWVSPELAKDYITAKRMGEIEGLFGDGLRDVRKNVDGTYSFIHGEKSTILKPDYLSAKGKIESPFTATADELMFVPKKSQTKSAKMGKSQRTTVASNIVTENKTVKSRAITKTTPKPDSIKSAVKELKNEVKTETVIEPVKTTVKSRNVIPGKAVKKIKDAGNAETASKKFVYGTPGKKIPTFKEIIQKTRQEGIDDLAVVRDAEIDLRGVKATRFGRKQLPSAEQSLYKTMRLSRGSPEAASLRIKDKLEPIVRNYEKAGGDSKKLGMYAEAVHAKDVNRAGIKSGLTDAEINDVIKKYGTPEAEAARKQLVRYSRELIEDLVDAGVLSKGDMAAMTTKWKNYMPLNRAMDSGETFDTFMKRSMLEAQSPIKALKGSDKKIIDPLASLIKNTYLTEASVAKGRVNKQVGSFAEHDTVGKYIKKLGAKESTDGENVVKILEDGKEVFYKLDPAMFRALEDMNKESSNIVIKILQAPASVLRAGAILNPEFATKNPIRDISQAFISSESGFNPITDFPRGLYSFLKKDDLYKDFVKEGGAFGVMVDIDRNAFKQSQKMVLSKTTGQKIVNGLNPATWLEGLRVISEASEMGTRVGEYKAALRSGASKSEAAYRARDLQDYFRKGSKVDMPNKIVAFLNANIQGKSRFIRAIERDPVGVGTRLLGIMAVPSLSAYACNRLIANDEQKRKIADAPQWEKDAFWLVAIPNTDQVLRFPKPFEGTPVSMMLERSLDYLIENDDKAFDTLARDLIRDQSLPIFPTAMLPIVEALADHSFFMDMPVVPQRLANLELKDQQDFRTSGVAKVLSAGVRGVAGDVKLGSPARMQHMIKGYTAGLGTYATDGIDILTGQNKKPTPGLTQLPAVKSLVMNPHTSGRSAEFVYSESDRLLKAKNSRPEEFKEDPQRRYLEFVKREMSEYSKQIRDVQNSDNMTGTRKREELDKLYRKRNQLSYKAMQDYEKVKEATDKLSKGIDDDELLMREVNKEVFGAKEALKRYNKKVYYKAVDAVSNKVTYDIYYNVYFNTKDIKSDKDKFGKSISAGSRMELNGSGKSASLKKREYIDTIPNLSQEDRKRLYEAFGISNKIAKRPFIVPKP